jgi:hypothetical protein
MALASSPAIRNVVVSAGCLAVAIFVLASNIRGRESQSDLAVATGTLNEWSVLASGKTLRFSFDGDHRDYRVDPTYFRDAMSQKVPSEFRRGARVEVSALQSELAYTSGSKNVWVRSISVDGKSILNTRSVNSVAQANDRWGYAFVLMAAVALIYNLVKWQFPGARPNTPLERARGR